MEFKIKKENGKEEIVDLVGVVKCDTCNCILNKVDAQEIKNNIYNSDYYCKEHTKKYDRILYCLNGNKMFYKEIKTDENGEPIGYKKK